MNNASESSNTQIIREYNVIIGKYENLINIIRRNYGVVPDRNE